MSIDYKKYRVVVVKYSDGTTKYRAQVKSGWWIFATWEDLDNILQTRTTEQLCDTESIAKKRLKSYIGRQVTEYAVEPFTKLDMMPDEPVSTSTTNTTTSPYIRGSRINPYDLNAIAQMDKKYGGPGAKSIK